MASLNESFEFTAGDGTRLVGTLTRPSQSGPAPAALLLNGSGPLDRNSNMPGQALDVANAFASVLVARGVASLRYDKRGVGESGGDYLTTGFDDETDDAAAALEALRTSAGVAAGRLNVVGHSVGSTIAIRLAGGGHELAGLVLLAASMQPGAEVMRRQSERIAATMHGPSRLLSGWFLRKQARIRKRLLAWSPTGEWLAFSTAARPPAGGSTLMVIGADGRGLRRVTRTAGPPSDFAASSRPPR